MCRFRFRPREFITDRPHCRFRNLPGLSQPSSPGILPAPGSAALIRYGGGSSADGSGVLVPLTNPLQPPGDPPQFLQGQGQLPPPQRLPCGRPAIVRTGRGLAAGQRGPADGAGPGPVLPGRPPRVGIVGDRAWRAYHSRARSRTFGFFGEPGTDTGRSSVGILLEARITGAMRTNLHIALAAKASHIKFAGVKFTGSLRRLVQGESGAPPWSGPSERPRRART